MNTLVIRTWKDPEYRTTLTADELAQLPPHPAGAIELTDADLEWAVSAGSNTGRPKLPKPPTPPSPEPPSGPRWRSGRPGLNSRNSTGKGRRR